MLMCPSWNPWFIISDLLKSPIDHILVSASPAWCIIKLIPMPIQEKPLSKALCSMFTVISCILTLPSYIVELIPFVIAST